MMHMGFASMIRVWSIGIGTAEYHIFAKLSEIDALLIASMILTEMSRSIFSKRTVLSCLLPFLHSSFALLSLLLIYAALLRHYP